MASVVITSVIVQCVRQVRGDVAIERQGAQIIRVSSKRRCQQAQRRESVRVHYFKCAGGGSLPSLPAC
jgi:hypothetical protein